MPDPLPESMEHLRNVLTDASEQISIAVKQVEAAMVATNAYRQCRRCYGVMGIEYFSKKKDTNRRATICIDCVSVEAGERRKGVQL